MRSAKIKTLKLCEWANYARGARGLRQFSKASGVAISLMSYIETGTLVNPTLSTLEKIAKASEGRCNVPMLTINPGKP